MSLEKPGGVLRDDIKMNSKYIGSDIMSQIIWFSIDSIVGFLSMLQ
jgi:hypothetical protein